MGTSVLRNAGLIELATTTEDDYMQVAVTLAHDLDRLETMRTTLRDRLRRSPLCDEVSFARQFEDALHRLARN